MWLAQIPFVRLKDAVKNKHQLKSHDTFSEVVHKINESFNDVKLVIDLASQSITVNEKFHISNLAPREFAMLHWFADIRKKGDEGIIAPRVNASSTKKISEDERLYLIKLTQEFKPYYENFKNTNEIVLDVDSKFFEGVKSHLKTALETALGLELAEKIAITQERDNKGRLKRGSPFYLNVQSENIEIIDNFEN